MTMTKKRSAIWMEKKLVYTIAVTCQSTRASVRLPPLKYYSIVNASFLLIIKSTEASVVTNAFEFLKNGPLLAVQLIIDSGLRNLTTIII